MRQSRDAIALLVTIMFVIVITVAIGFGLKQVNRASQTLNDENFMFQSSMFVEDILKILQTSTELQQIAENNNSIDELYMFLSEAAFIPFDSQGYDVVLQISSARAKFNPSTLNSYRADALRGYMSNYMVNSQYVDILVDSMSKIKEDNSYNSRIFDENPYLFRDYIASKEQLGIINDFYTTEYNDNALANIDFDELFYLSADKNTTIDLNYATPAVWELILGVSKERAELLNYGGGSYTDIASLHLNSDEEERLLAFMKPVKPSFYEPILFIELTIRKNKSRAYISFEYNIKLRKGSNFAYEI